ncbi:hypothetical protein GT204_17725 [Streptomyces sp. SID4919]|uniref:hypothetical protein n=1 Tax=unclassified Streptomyces TaxID=2593676 RepID=UPI00082381CD|nr:MULTISPECIES: hypothetical protein [unclassified Streptomyces]MYY10701.1 hypothetical protein [Streptomyces sp. SID4919]SCK62330.1 hypothetical protein YW7DRAFT_06579 [Streptomyces sp. AmelKG-E11A]
MSAPSSRTTAFAQQMPDRLSIVGPGWRSLLMRLHEQLLALVPDYRLDELTSKLDGLRIYVTDRFEDDGEFDGTWADTGPTHLSPYGEEMVDDARGSGEAMMPVGLAWSIPSTGGRTDVPGASATDWLKLNVAEGELNTLPFDLDRRPPPPAARSGPRPTPSSASPPPARDLGAARPGGPGQWTTRTDPADRGPRVTG